MSLSTLTSRSGRVSGRVRQTGEGEWGREYKTGRVEQGEWDREWVGRVGWREKQGERGRTLRP